MISPAKLEANRRNALKSTGPKTEAGKARSSRNAVTHGLTAQPGEPSEAYLESLAEWVSDLKPRGVLERTLTERACRAAWNLRRCDRFEDAATFFLHRDAAESEARAEADRVEDLGRRLMALLPKEDDRKIVRDAPGPDDDDPAELAAELRRSAAGAAWMRARWQELAGALPGKGWDASHKYKAGLLLGLSLDEADAHRVLGSFVPRTTDCRWPPGGGSWNDYPGHEAAMEQAARRARDGGEIRAIMANWRRRVVDESQPDMAAADRKRLAALVRREREKLERLMHLVLNERQNQDRAGAADRAMFDDPPTITLCLRYAGAASRDLHRAIRDLAKLQKAGEGEDIETPQPSSQSDDGSDGPPSGEAPKRRGGVVEKRRNKATKGSAGGSVTGAVGAEREAVPASMTRDGEAGKRPARDVGQRGQHGCGEPPARKGVQAPGRVRPRSQSPLPSTNAKHAQASPVASAPGVFDSTMTQQGEPPARNGGRAPGRVRPRSPSPWPSTNAGLG